MERRVHQPSFGRASGKLNGKLSTLYFGSPPPLLHLRMHMATTITLGLPLTLLLGRDPAQLPDNAAIVPSQRSKSQSILPFPRPQANCFPPISSLPSRSRSRGSTSSALTLHSGATIRVSASGTHCFSSALQRGSGVARKLFTERPTPPCGAISTLRYLRAPNPSSEAATRPSVSRENSARENRSDFVVFGWEEVGFVSPREIYRFKSISRLNAVFLATEMVLPWINRHSFHNSKSS